MSAKGLLPIATIKVGTTNTNIAVDDDALSAQDVRDRAGKWCSQRDSERTDSDDGGYLSRGRVKFLRKQREDRLR